jgi:hypothetical protein
MRRTARQLAAPACPVGFQAVWRPAHSPFRFVSSTRPFADSMAIAPAHLRANPCASYLPNVSASRPVTTAAMLASRTDSGSVPVSAMKSSLPKRGSASKKLPPTTRASIPASRVRFIWHYSCQKSTGKTWSIAFSLKTAVLEGMTRGGCVTICHTTTQRVVLRLARHEPWD